MPRHVVIATVLMALLCGVAAAPQSREPLASVPTLAVPGEFVWHDLVTDDQSACRAFYGALFGWTFEAGDGIDPGYTIIKHDGVPIGGIVPRAPGRRRPPSSLSGSPTWSSRTWTPRWGYSRSRAGR